MAYDPDDQLSKNILESRVVFKNKDRQEVYDSIVEHLAKRFGVTVVGDLLTVRTINTSATFVLLEVQLPRDIISEDE